MHIPIRNGTCTALVSLKGQLLNRIASIQPLFSWQKPVTAMQYLFLLSLALLLVDVQCQLFKEQFWIRWFEKPDKPVETPLGPVSGRHTAFFSYPMKEYLGIPYAAPPIGEKRFRPPVPAPPFSETFQATDLPPSCPQFTRFDYPWADNDYHQSEDCLYLNIWIPMLLPTSEPLKVVFFIHGGDFATGSNSILHQSGIGLSQLAEAVVVAPNYRLGPLGFLSDGTEDAPGNVGLQDLLLALRWTKDNIASFQGDPEQITIMGQGSGATTVGLLLLSPTAQGLYTRAIMQSGSPDTLPRDPNTRNTQLANQLAEVVDCQGDNDTSIDIDCLRNVSALRLVQISMDLDPLSFYSFTPQYGDALLPKPPQDLLTSGSFSPVPLLIGSNKDEGAHLLTTRYPDIFGPFGEKDALVSKDDATQILKETFRYYPDPDAVIQQYLEDVEDDEFDKIRRNVYYAMGDFNITCPSVYFAEQYHQKGGGTVQYYVFGQRSNETQWAAKWMGSAFWEEVPYVMGRYLVSYDYDSFQTSYTADSGLSNAMATIWGNFMTNGSGFPKWHNYSRTHHQYVLMKFNKPRKTRGPGPHTDNCDFFREYFGY